MYLSIFYNPSHHYPPIIPFHTTMDDYHDIDFDHYYFYNKLTISTLDSCKIFVSISFVKDCLSGFIQNIVLIMVTYRLLMICYI